MKNGSQEDSDFIYELTRENKSLILEIEGIQEKMTLLKLHLMEVEKSHLELVSQLKHAKQEVKQLTVELEDANNLKWQYSGLDRRKIDVPYHGPDRRQSNLSSTQH